MAITARDLAKKLGVSPTTVSLSLNGRRGVSDETRARVVAEAERLGYTLQKRQNVTQSIRYVIFLESGTAVKETSFYSIVLQGVEARAKEFGCNVLISYFYAEDNWADQIAALASNVSGIIVLATELEDRHIELARTTSLSRQDIPVVLVDNATTLIDVDCVVADNLGGASRAVDYLLHRGHLDVGYLKSKLRINSFVERERGAMQARAARGLSAPCQVVDVSVAAEQAFRDFCSWLDGGGVPRSAYFADNDIIAAACIRALKSRGYRVPEDVSVVGFDDMPICTMVDPTLTTMRILKEEMGAVAMDILHRRIAGKGHGLSGPRQGVYRLTISTQLVERESAADYFAT